PSRRQGVAAVAAWTAYDRGDFQVARSRALDAIREGIPADGPATAWAQAHIAVSFIEFFSGNFDAARRLIVDGLHALENNPDLVARADLMFRLSNLESMIGSNEEARLQAAETLRLARLARQPSALVGALFARAFSEDDPELVRTALEEGIALSRAGASDSQLSFALALVARLHAQSGDARTALHCLVD